MKLKITLTYLVFIFTFIIEAKSNILDDKELTQKNYRFIIEFKRIISNIEEQSIKKILSKELTNEKYSFGPFDNYKNNYFKRVYLLEFNSKKYLKKNVLSKLKSLNLINIIEKIFLIEELSIVTNPDSKLLSDDLFFNYQWGIMNDGQKILKDISDIKFETIEGKEDADIGIKKIFKIIPNLMKKEIIVAVLDSGIDVDHPELKDKIKKNLKECVDGTIPFKPKTDNDGNGYKGDCMGWNFTSRQKGGDNKPYDKVGHGTHVAGIIASVSNNKKGITGLTNKLKILPIKVLKKVENAHVKSNNGSLSDRIAKGILYAIKRKADVINMSLGWPLSMDTKYLRMAVKAALKQNITIVAAAGNNSNSSMIFPCAYKGVICVGASTINGQYSNFTNFGGHVDITAPGDNILSTFPTTLTPNHFSVKGFEIKNGTSQAAPFISAIVGILKGINNGITNDEIYARLILGARLTDFFNVDEKKYSLNGLVHVENSLKLTETPTILPMYKDLKDLVLNNHVNDNDHYFNINIPIKNYWKDSSNIKIKFSIDNRHVKLNESSFNITKLRKGEIKNLRLTGNISDLDKDNSIMLNCSIFIKDIKTHQSKKQMKIVRNLDNDPNLIINRIITDENEKVARFKSLKKNGEIKSLLHTITDPYHVSIYPQYFLIERVKNGNIVKIFKYNELNKSYQKQKINLKVPNATKILSIIFLDINYDGESDYFVRSIAKLGNDKFIQYSFFDQNGNPLFKKYSHWKFTPKVAIINYKTLRFISYYSQLLKKEIRIPIFMEKGKIPEKDLNPNPWEQEGNYKTNHFYYFTPSKLENNIIQVEANIIDNYKWTDQLIEKLKLDWDEEINLLQILPQPKDDFKHGIVQALISVGKNYFRKYYIISLTTTGHLQYRYLYTDSTHLEGFSLFPTINLNLLNNKLESNHSSLLAGYNDETTMTITHINDNLSRPYATLDFKSIYRREYKRDHILGVLASYKKGNEFYTFFQTKNHLLLHSYSVNDGRVTCDSHPITRFSFLPGNLFSEIFYPIVKNNGKESIPALYVDATALNRKDIYLLTLNNQNKLQSPIKYNIRVPKNCTSMNPVPYGPQRFFSFTLLCHIENKWYFYFYPLN